MDFFYEFHEDHQKFIFSFSLLYFSCAFIIKILVWTFQVNFNPVALQHTEECAHI